MQYYSLEIDKYTIWIYFKNSERQLVSEARRKGIHLTGPYSFIKHPPHNPTGDYHLHIYYKQNELFSINKGGTGHDSSGGFRIPNRIADELRWIFPKWKIPKDNIIESKTIDLTKMMIEIILK